MNNKCKYFFGKNLLVYFFISIFSIFILEVISGLVNYSYDSYRNVEHFDFSDASDTFDRLGDITSDHIDYLGKNYQFKDFLMFKNSQFSSDTLNINDFGVRSNGGSVKGNDGSGEIWVLGSSALFGYPNLADDQTLAARLEQDLRKSGHKYVVKNFGVNGYKSVQDRLTLEMEIVRSRPAAVVVFNGHNDLVLNLDFQYEQTTQVHDALAYYWRMHQDKGYVNWMLIYEGIQNLLPETFALSNRSIKLFYLLLSKYYPDYFMSLYRNYSMEIIEKQKKFYKGSTNFYLRNMKGIIDTNSSYGVCTMLIHQPNIYASKKLLSKHESLLFDNAKKSYLLIEPEDLQDGYQFQTYDVNPLLGTLGIVFSNKIYSEALMEQVDQLEKLAKNNNVLFLNGYEVVDAMPKNKTAFYDWVHLTDFAIKRFSAIISSKIKSDCL